MSIHVYVHVHIHNTCAQLHHKVGWKNDVHAVYVTYCILPPHKVNQIYMYTMDMYMYCI